ncbi:MAG: MBL fold metallo-hydrolase [Ruminococcaceae bacterium]|nr:MBL fold metallo-hydrolase [Oscillospiraceae bacterium]
MQVKTITVGALQTNCYLLFDPDSREAYVVDPGDEAQDIADAVEELSLQVLAIVLTHVHFDHMLAAESLCRRWHAPLWIGADDQPALTDSRRNLMDLFSPGAVLMLQAQRLLFEGDVLPLGRTQLTVMETPGHTPGSLCLVTDEAIISGDTLFCGSIGRTDFPGGNALTLYGSLARLMSIEGDRTVYPGHGEPTSLSYERTTNPFVLGKVL